MVSVTRSEDDISLLRLNSIQYACLRHIKKISIQKAVRLPTYDAWVPVIQNHFVDDLDVEPYHPYFGDSKEQRDLAKGVFDTMMFDKDIGPFDEPSDAEIGPSGRLLPRKPLVENGVFNDLQSIRNRAAQRHGILVMTRRHGKLKQVWAALSEAFGIADARRLEYICSLSERRECESIKHAAKMQKSRIYANAIRQVAQTSTCEIVPTHQNKSSPATGSLKMFCFACHRFACHLHSSENVAPKKLIPDHAAEGRRRAIRGGGRLPPPCSQCCFLRATTSRRPVGEREGETWTEEQIQILRQTALMFGIDPCSLAIVLGGKTCREVYERLNCAEEANMIEDFRHAWHLNDHVRGPNYNSDDDEPIARGSRKRRRRKTRENPTAKKSALVPAKYGSQCTIEERKGFKPCNHEGGCFKKNSCICAINSLNCEAQCGCRCGRYVAGLKGMKWEAPSEEDIRAGAAAKCKLRSWGCKCRNGHCNTSRCDCFVYLKACNPDFCSCDCCILPSKISVRQRQCRSAGTITSIHKRTLIGRSTVHGFGLFAAESFATGDLIGQYCGRIMSPELITKSLRIPQAEKKTYAFEMTDSLTVDGGSIGSKVKFINHSVEPAKINCEARIESVRGAGRVVLRALKTICPGEEFLFNYNLLDEEGNDWMIQKNTGAAEEDFESESESDSYSSGQTSDAGYPQLLFDPAEVAREVKEEDQEALL